MNGSEGYAGGTNLLEMEPLADAPESNATTRRLYGVETGRLVALAEGGVCLVAHVLGGVERTLAARTTVPLSVAAPGAGVVLAFERGDPALPIVLGCLVADGSAEASVDGGSPGEAKPQPAASSIGGPQLSTELDGERLVVSADREIVLRCGRSSITLTRAGKILIRGAYLLSRSSGVNRIKGASVQIN